MEKENLEIYETIQQYLAGTLSPKDKTAFDAKMKADPELEAEFLLHKNIDALRYERNDKLQEGLAILQEIQLGDNENITPEPVKIEGKAENPAKRIPMKIGWRQLAGIAATFLIPICIWFLWPDNLYEKYGIHDNLELVEMSGQGSLDKLKLDLQTAYNNKHYGVALGYCETYLKQKLDDYEVQLAKGICLLELDRYSEALTVFKQYAYGSAGDKIKGEWYQAMTYLKQDDKAQCKAILQKLQGQGFKEDTVVALLQEL